MTKPVGYLVNTSNCLVGERGTFYDYILARNGLFIQAKSEFFAATVCIAPQEVRGLIPMDESLELRHGKVPRYFLELALSVLCTRPEIEQYLAVVWDGQYHIVTPEQSQNTASVTYEVPYGAVMDIHSHTGDGPPHFSGIDDHDEAGFRLYAVVSGLRNLFPTVAIRLGVYGYFVPVSKEDVFV